MDDPHRWWRQGVLYQIYPRSWSDSNADGIGDIKGITGRLDYLSWLGIDGIWLNPTMPSPNRDWGYDVSDYLGVHPELGTPADLDELIQAAGARGIRVLLDLVPNHTSDRHPWFQSSGRSPASAHRDWYVWADPGPGGTLPNNWLSAFGGPAWTLHEGTGQFYMHNFLFSQPDLNWWNREVAEAFDDILRFWFERGVAGFRIDVAHAIVKDRHLRDDPEPTAEDHPTAQAEGRRRVYSMNRPETHEVHKRWRRIANSWDPPRLLVGETYVWDVAGMVSYYGENDQLHLALNIPFVFAPFQPGPLKAVVEETEALLPEGAWPAWTGSNHDALRFPTRWCDDDPDLARCALVMLLTLRGTPFLYYGDEIGMGNVIVPGDRLLDIAGRDFGRTPMQWDSGPGGGFTVEDAEPWLPLGDLTCNVSDQRRDEGSVLHLTRDLISLRRSRSDLAVGRYRSHSSPVGTWVYSRGERTVVALNMGDAPATCDDVSGTVVLCTTRGREGDKAGPLSLGPREAAVVDVG
jgi:alpha-glucosidase